MSIPVQYSRRYLYHFTHLDNLPLLLRTGFLAKNHPNFPVVGSTSIAAASIQERRAGMIVPCGAGGVVHDYVPFYFGSLSPMLLGVVNKKNVDQEEILYFEFPISLLTRRGAVFTDASANTGVPPNFYDDLQSLSKLNWAEIDSLKWGSGDEVLRHRRMAEGLIPSSVAVQEASRVIVWNDSIKEQIERVVQELEVQFPPIEFESRDRRHYFTKFNDPHENGHSIVTGPKGVASQYSAACEQINQAARPRPEATFNTPKDLLEALRKDFASLPHTAELIGLKSENGMHKRTVEVHTAEVVAKLLGLQEFAELPPVARDRVELAAQLHDIGKGPKSRWSWNNGLQKVDPAHPVRAMPMMVEIFLDHISKATPESVAAILKLVCYHDLVGEVLGKERDEQQIVDVAADRLELDMLFALGKADATALSEAWWDQGRANALYSRCESAIRARSVGTRY
jgi:hypothetical protein